MSAERFFVICMIFGFTICLVDTIASAYERITAPAAKSIKWRIERQAVIIATKVGTGEQCRVTLPVGCVIEVMSSEEKGEVLTEKADDPIRTDGN